MSLLRPRSGYPNDCQQIPGESPVLYLFSALSRTEGLSPCPGPFPERYLLTISASPFANHSAVLGLVYLAGFVDLQPQHR